MKKKKIGRNEPCPCGSGKKYKSCCIGNACEAGESSATNATAQGFNLTYAYDSMMLANPVGREATLVAEHFDALCHEHVTDIDEVYSAVARAHPFWNDAG